MKSPIHSRKHIVQMSQSQVMQSQVVTTNLINSIEGTHTSPDHVSEGAVVKACYVELWVGIDAGTAIGSYTAILYKDPGSSNTATAANMAALYDYTNKKNILFTAQGLLAPETGGVIPVMRDWYKIPKGKQRFGLQDKLRVAVRNNNAAATDIHFCGLSIYKEYT